LSAEHILPKFFPTAACKTSTDVNAPHTHISKSHNLCDYKKHWTAQTRCILCPICTKVKHGIDSGTANMAPDVCFL